MKVTLYLKINIWKKNKIINDDINLNLNKIKSEKKDNRYFNSLYNINKINNNNININNNSDLSSDFRKNLGIMTPQTIKQNLSFSNLIDIESINLFSY